MIDTFVAGLKANACTVAGPLDVDAARAAVVERASGVVACNDDVPIPDLVAALRGAGTDVLTPDNPMWSERLASVGVGVTGAWCAVAEPAAIGIMAAPGSPRATSLVPPTHVCVVRVADVVASLDDAFARLASRALPSALTWVGGPSRTGDLEMILTLGVHGPRAVDVILLD